MRISLVSDLVPGYHVENAHQHRHMIILTGGGQGWIHSVDPDSGGVMEPGDVVHAPPGCQVAFGTQGSEGRIRWC